MMDFDHSKPQKMLQDSVKEFLSRHCTLERVRELMETATAVDDELWEGLTDQGWVALTLPEDYEGLELGAVDLVAVTEAMGSYCMPGPFVSNLWAAEVVAGGDAEVAKEILPGVADGETKLTIALLEDSASWDVADVALSISDAADGFTVSGEKLFVSDAEVADFILVVGRIGGELAVVSVPSAADGVTLEPMPALDATRKLYKAVFDGAAANALVARGDAADKALADATRLATVAVCGELVGGMQWVLDTTVEYAKTREQFGRAIGSFQAVQHMCADILFNLESARSAVYYAAWAVSVDDPGADAAVSVAKAFCSDAARETGNLGIQSHGGIGFTWEHDLHLFYKRAKANEILFGDATFHRNRIAAKVIDEGVAISE
jgi:alkylation response protein AidB-like acyl-CoA dehydrogenase